VTLTIAPLYAHRAAHLYNPARWNSGGAYRVDRHERAVTFLPCDDDPAQFVGGFVFTGDPCVEVEVTIGEGEPYRAALPFSSAPCSESITTQTPSDCPGFAPFLTGGADALPAKGQTAEERVAEIVARDRDQILAATGAVEVRMVERRGEVWIRDNSTGGYTIERVVDFQIEVLLDREADCLHSYLLWQGIPVVANRAWTTHEVQGLRFDAPRDWHVADEPLAPDQGVGLRQVVAIGTSPPRPGTDLCDFYPQFALDDLGPEDALIVLRRLSGQPGMGPPSVGPISTEPFSYEWLDERGEIGVTSCLSRPDADDLYMRWAYFDAHWLVLVAVGDDASDQTRAQVLQVLNSMEWIGN
jgi:hypothetical protein